LHTTSHVADPRRRHPGRPFAQGVETCFEEQAFKNSRRRCSYAEGRSGSFDLSTTCSRTTRVPANDASAGPAGRLAGQPLAVGGENGLLELIEPLRRRRGVPRPGQAAYGMDITEGGRMRGGDPTGFPRRRLTRGEDILDGIDVHRPRSRSPVVDDRPTVRGRQTSESTYSGKPRANPRGSRRFPPLGSRAGAARSWRRRCLLDPLLAGQQRPRLRPIQAIIACGPRPSSCLPAADPAARTPRRDRWPLLWKPDDQRPGQGRTRSTADRRRLRPCRDASPSREIDGPTWGSARGTPWASFALLPGGGWGGTWKGDGPLLLHHRRRHRAAKPRSGSTSRREAPLRNPGQALA